MKKKVWKKMEKKGTALCRSHSIKSPVFLSLKHISETLEFTKIKQLGLRKERKNEKNIKIPIQILLKTNKVWFCFMLVSVSR